jgi:hypothetical protein
MFQYEPENLPDFRRGEHDISSAALKCSATSQEAVLGTLSVTGIPVSTFRL